MPVTLLHSKFEDITEWEDYVEVIMASGFVDHCSIYTRRGRVLASTDKSNSLTVDELLLVLDAFSNPTSDDYQTITLNDECYKAVMNDGAHGILLKCGQKFATVSKTAKVIIFGIHKIDATPEKASEAVMNLSDFLVAKRM